MKHVIIGTAGHIDHGKTRLTKALTGIDTDRLPEEKQREMSIELGFAPFSLTDELTASVVDVPGHERFIKNMVAGVGGIDIVLLTVAADDGVMPQTVEHLQIVKLLGLKHGIIALTKADLVDEEMLELVKDEIEQLVGGTFLQGSPVLPVSVIDGRGLDEVKKEISIIAHRVERRNPEGVLMLPVDRVFTMSGFGTVITGTLMSGKVKTGTRVEILPQDLTSRVRGIQIHKHQAQEAVAGQRTALNLADVSKSEIHRGDVISHPGLIEPTRVVEAKLELLADTKRTLKYWRRIRFHTGTSEIMARVKPLGIDEVKPGETAFVQFRLEKPLAARRGERFIIRSYSPQTTIGGGVILDAYPGRHRRHDKVVLNRLETMAGGKTGDIILSCLDNGYQENRVVQRRLQFTDLEFDDAIRQLLSSSRVRVLKQYLFAEKAFQKFSGSITDRVTSLHDSSPLKSWLAKDKIYTRLKLDREVFNLLVGQMNEVETRGDLVRRTGWQPQLSTAEMKKREEMERTFLAAKFAPPLTKPDALLKILVDDGVLVKIASELFFHRQCLDDAKNMIRKHISAHGPATAADLKNVLQTTRKYAIPLLEYLDGIKFTERTGNTRIIGGG